MSTKSTLGCAWWTGGSDVVLCGGFAARTIDEVRLPKLLRNSYLLGARSSYLAKWAPIIKATGVKLE